MISAGSVTVRLRNEVSIEDPLGVVLGFLERWAVQPAGASTPTRFTEPDLRLANRGGARISAAEIAAILERRTAIERALRTIPPGASLARAGVPWEQLRRLFDAFADIRGVGYSKVTKALNPKRPALIPMLDSVVQRYLEDDDPGAKAPFGERALALMRGYKRDLDGHRTELRSLQLELRRRDHELTEVRILDLLIWSAQA
jgi:Family of unknown function (DUF6308)